MTDHQGPTDFVATSFNDLLAIVMHPAFRLGFFDAQHGRVFDHDDIAERIRAETPPRALQRLGWDDDLLDARSIELAQYRYEEGRLAVIQEGLRCRAWGHPDYPPAAVRRYIAARAGNPSETASR